MAKVSLLQGTRLSQAMRVNPPSVVAGYVTAGREGQAWLRRLCEDHDVPGPGRPAWTYATTRVGELRARAELAVARQAGFDAAWAEPDLPFATRGGVRLAAQFQLHPGELVDALVSALLDHGAFFARLQPRRSYAAALRSSWSAPGMYLSAQTPTHSVRSVPTLNGELLLVGGEGHVTGRHGHRGSTSTRCWTGRGRRSRSPTSPTPGPPRTTRR
jgi:hypothetical protein